MRLWQVISIDLRTNLSHGVGVIHRNADQSTSVEEEQLPNQQVPTTQHSDSEEIRYVYILNRVLPAEIRVLAWCPVDPSFSARFSCTSRTYKYFFPRGTLDLDRMMDAGRALIGEHDFRNLCKMDVGNGVVAFRRHITAVDLAVCRFCQMRNNKSSPNVSFNNTISTSSSQDCNEPNVTGNKAAENFLHLGVEERSVSNTDDSYEICELTITGQAFLWHQIRCIVAVLFLIGQGRENPSIISELLDVDRHPRKPQYTMAAEFPLILFDCEYDNDDVEWLQDIESDDISRSMQALWTQHAVRAAMLRRMLSEQGRCGQHQTDCLVPGSRSRTYRPLFERELCESLEDRIGHYTKRQKLTASETTSRKNNDTHLDAASDTL